MIERESVIILLAHSGVSELLNDGLECKTVEAARIKIRHTQTALQGFIDDILERKECGQCGGRFDKLEYDGLCSGCQIKNEQRTEW